MTDIQRGQVINGCLNASEKSTLGNEPESQRQVYKQEKANTNKDKRQILRPVAVKSRLWTCTEHNMFSGVVKLVLMAPNHPTYNTAKDLNRRTFKNL